MCAEEGDVRNRISADSNENELPADGLPEQLKFMRDLEPRND